MVKEKSHFNGSTLSLYHLQKWYSDPDWRFLAYRAISHTSRRISPPKVLMGRETEVPSDTFPPKVGVSNYNAPRYPLQLKEMGQIFGLWKEHLGLPLPIQIMYHENTVKPSTVQEGMRLTSMNWVHSTLTEQMCPSFTNKLLRFKLKF